MEKVNVCKSCIKHCKIAGLNQCPDYKSKKVNFYVVALLVWSICLIVVCLIIGYQWGLYQNRKEHNFLKKTMPEYKEYMKFEEKQD